MKPTLEIDVAKVESYSARGLTQAEIAQNLGISERTLYRRKRCLAVMAEAIKKGRARGIALVADKLFELARAGELGAICFYLKCRAGWSEKTRAAPAWTPFDGRLPAGRQIDADPIAAVEAALREAVDRGELGAAIAQDPLRGLEVMARLRALGIGERAPSELGDSELLGEARTILAEHERQAPAPPRGNGSD